jgi:RNA polymerase sigma factor (sigma-70 family)
MGDEEKIVKEALAGSEEAFHELVRLHQAHVRAYLTRYVRDAQVVLDLAQETFLRLFRSAPRYSEQGLLRALLFRIATNLLRSEERRERRQRLLAPLLGTIRHAEAAAPSGLLAAELHREVGAAIAALPPLGVRAAVRALRAAPDQTLTQQLELEWQLQRAAFASRDSRAALAAFRTKTETTYEGK